MSDTERKVSRMLESAEKAGFSEVDPADLYEMAEQEQEEFDLADADERPDCLR